MLTPRPVDRPCPCDGVLLAGDSAEIFYLNTPHTTIVSKVRPLQQIYIYYAMYSGRTHQMRGT